MHFVEMTGVLDRNIVISGYNGSIFQSEIILGKVLKCAYLWVELDSYAKKWVPRGFRILLEHVH